MRVAKGLAVVCAIAVVFAPTIAFAEVMDKEASVPAVWAMALLPGLVGLTAWLVLPRHIGAILGGVSLLAGAVLLAGVFAEVSDPFVGPAIIAEAGTAYVMNFASAAVVFVMLEVFGLVAWRRRSPNKRFQRTADMLGSEGDASARR